MNASGFGTGPGLLAVYTSNRIKQVQMHLGAFSGESLHNDSIVRYCTYNAPLPDTLPLQILFLFSLALGQGT